MYVNVYINVCMYVCMGIGLGDHPEVHSSEEEDIRIRGPGSIPEGAQGSEIIIVKHTNDELW